MSRIAPAFALVSLLVASGVSTAHADGATDWVDVYTKQGLAVMWRAVQGTKFKEIRGVGILPIPAEQLMAALTDVPHYPEFMPPAVETKRIWTRGGESVFYLVVDPPVVRKRDYCVHIKVRRLPTGQLENTWRLTDDGCPPVQKGMVRMVKSEGRWLLTPQADGTTMVDYSGVTDPGGALPAWIVNRSTASTLSSMFFSLAKAAATARYRGCVGESFGC